MKRKNIMNVPLGSEQTLELCERAVKDLGWSITGQNETRLRAKLGMTLTSYQIVVICEVESKTNGETTLYVQVETTGYGPIVGRRLNEKLDVVCRRIALLVRRAAPKDEPRNPEPAPMLNPTVITQGVNVAEIEQYADLHDQGVLSDDEFIALKRQWLHALGV